MNAEAYVLFYRKNSMRIEPLREEVQTYLDQGSSLVQFYISRQWLNKFENFAKTQLLVSAEVSPAKFATWRASLESLPWNKIWTWQPTKDTTEMAQQPS